MRILHHVLLSATFSLLAASVGATPAAPQNGAEYKILSKPQSVEPGKKVEVTEFFWYSCPHCFALEPALEAWLKKEGDKIVFKRVPVLFRDTFVPQQKLYYALEAMGKSEEMQMKVFDAIHVQHQNLDTDATILDFVVKHGIDKQKFVAMYDAFGTQAKVRRAKTLQENYKIDSVPTLAVDGKYMTSPALAGASLGQQPEAALGTAAVQVLDVLVARAQVERNKSGAVKADAVPTKMPAPVKTVVKK